MADMTGFAALGAGLGQGYLQGQQQMRANRIQDESIARETDYRNRYLALQEQHFKSEEAKQQATERMQMVNSLVNLAKNTGDFEGAKATMKTLYPAYGKDLDAIKMDAGTQNVKMSIGGYDIETDPQTAFEITDTSKGADPTIMIKRLMVGVQTGKVSVVKQQDKAKSTIVPFMNPNNGEFVKNLDTANPAHQQEILSGALVPWKDRSGNMGAEERHIKLISSIYGITDAEAVQKIQDMKIEAKKKTRTDFVMEMQRTAAQATAGDTELANHAAEAAGELWDSLQVSKPGVGTGGTGTGGGWTASAGTFTGPGGMKFKIILK